MKKKSKLNSNELILRNVEPRPLRKRVKKGNDEIVAKLNDAEVIDVAVKTVHEYVKVNGKLPPGISGKFIQWLEEADKAVKDGTSVVKYKQTTISRTVSDYRDIEGVTD